MIYSQVQGDNMKNSSLFMMFTLLGVPGFVTAAGSDLAHTEYNFAVNELSRSSLNQAAIIGQQGVNNDAQVRQGGSKLLSVVSQEGTGNRARVDQSGTYNFAYIAQSGSSNDASITQGAFGNTAMIIQKGSGNKANITQYGTQKTAVVVQRQSQMAIRVIQR
ncbi:Minor curlin subunit [Enterobacter cancerogenus]|uniref:Minor curlin subunit n=2 Tax=Enterobacter cancerogenus TaxID=69218 RepID=A0A484X8Y6_9ENTR|nr:Minor curlin subunit [Enterobacter cancerogenus]